MPDKKQVELEEPTGGSGMSEVEMRADLDRDFEKVRLKRGQVKTQQIVGSKKNKDTNIKLLKELFALMQEAGVDPNDIEAVSKFNQELEHQDPDLFELFQGAIEGLSPEGFSGTESPTGQREPLPAQAPQAGLMNNKLSPQARMLG